MGSRDRPGKEAKKKPKDKESKLPRLESLLGTASPSAELIKPKRKPRSEKAPEENEE
jgi:hypothetical protein